MGSLHALPQSQNVTGGGLVCTFDLRRVMKTRDLAMLVRPDDDVDVHCYFLEASLFEKLCFFSRGITIVVGVIDVTSLLSFQHSIVCIVNI
jgi:hypothetical protein